MECETEPKQIYIKADGIAQSRLLNSVYRRKNREEMQGPKHVRELSGVRVTLSLLLLFEVETISDMYTMTLHTFFSLC
jgi:hypothetical protein